MNSKVFSISWLVIVAALVALFSLAFSIKSLSATIFVFIAVIALVYLFKNHTKDIINDERAVMIREKASLRALQTFAIAGLVLASVLISTQKAGSPLESSGTILAHLVSALMLLYLAFYVYYGKKYGELQ